MGNTATRREDSLFPGLAAEIGDFNRFDRLAEMQQRATFVPQSWEELRLAFLLWLRGQTQALTAADYLDQVQAHQKDTTGGPSGSGRRRYNTVHGSLCLASLGVTWLLYVMSAEI